MPGQLAEQRVVLVSRVKRNPYVSLLCQGLAQIQVGQDEAHIQPRIIDRFSLQWMWQNRHQVDVLHIHWLELLFVYPTLARSLKRWASVMLGLLLARLSGICVVYTVHNILQHEGRRAGLVRWGNRVIFGIAHAVHVHDQETAERLRRKWGRQRGVYVIPHGNYVSAYPNNCTRTEARKQLNLNNSAFVYLFLGRVRPYKGIEELLAAFKALEDSDATLLVAGEAHEPSYIRRIRELADGDERIRLHLEFVADDNLQVYLNACDICVLPYQRVTTSGAAFLAFSFRVPIIAPKLGCFMQLVGEKERGILYGAGAYRPGAQAPSGLHGALRQARQCDLKTMSAACARFVERFDWDSIAQQHAAMYQLGSKKPYTRICAQ